MTQAGTRETTTPFAGCRSGNPIAGGLRPSVPCRTDRPLPLHYDFTEITRRDVKRAELVILPVVPVLLLLVFGSVVAAAVPFCVGLLAAAGGMAGTFLLSKVIAVSLYAVNVITMIGLAVAIDYSLLIVSRHREEIRRRGGEEALGRTMATAGSTILFSGLTVAGGLLRLCGHGEKARAGRAGDGDDPRAARGRRGGRRDNDLTRGGENDKIIERTRSRYTHLRQPAKVGRPRE